MALFFCRLFARPKDSLGAIFGFSSSFLSLMDKGCSDTASCSAGSTAGSTAGSSSRRSTKSVSDGPGDGGDGNGTGNRGGLGGRKNAGGGPKLTVIQKSEQVILSFVQQIEKLGTAEGISVVLPKHAAALTEKIAGRLDSKLKAVYAEDWTPGTDFTRGMQVLSKLEVAHAASLKITAFSNCFHKKETSAETLLQSIVALQDESKCVDFAELRIDPRAYEEYAKRTCEHAAKDYDWASISLALSKNSKVVELYEQSLLSKWKDSGSDFGHKKNTELGKLRLTMVTVSFESMMVGLAESVEKIDEQARQDAAAATNHAPEGLATGSVASCGGRPSLPEVRLWGRLLDLCNTVTSALSGLSDVPTSSAATSAELELDPSLWPTLAPNLKAFHVLGSVGIYFGDSGTPGDDAIKEALSKTDDKHATLWKCFHMQPFGVRLLATVRAYQKLALTMQGITIDFETLIKQVSGAQVLTTDDFYKNSDITFPQQDSWSLIL